MNWITLLKYLPTIVGAVWSLWNTFHVNQATAPQLGSFPVDYLAYGGLPFAVGAGLTFGAHKVRLPAKPDPLAAHIKVIGSELGTAASRGDVASAKILLDAINGLKGISP